MDNFSYNLKSFFSNDNFVILKNADKYLLASYHFVYETIQSNNKYTILLRKGNFKIKPIISICIPTFNNNDYVLLKALKEWEKSKNINLNLVEFVIVENGSNTYKDILSKNFNLKIKFINIKEKNLGKARKISVEEASSDLLLLVNDDTIPTEFLIERHIKYQVENYHNKLAILGTFYFHKDVLDTEFMKIIKDDKNLFFQNFFEDNIITNAFVTNNISIKKEYVIKAGNFDENLKISGEDNDLEKRLSRYDIKTLFKSDLISYHYHRHDCISYINLLKNRYYFDLKINLKYKYGINVNIYLDLFKINGKNIIAYFFLNYFCKNYNNDIYLKKYLELVHIIFTLIADDFNENFFENIKLKNTNSKILIVIFGKENYSIQQTYKNFEKINITKNTKLYEIIKKYDYFLFIDSNNILLPYAVELFLLLTENLDKSYKIILGRIFQKNENSRNFIILNIFDFFIKRECFINPLLLERNIDKNLLMDLKSRYKYAKINIPCTSIIFE
ncbi:MAG: hypothetical protein KatS3mg068_0060 [Candidatus Sericytochromatia bacterium]|nr:MAG: hypothetical protein KatS3mg068_0060 [Candidatus Sericytochromatia bacterium]